MDAQVTYLREIRLALQRGDYAAAITNLEQVVTLARERGDTSAEGRHLGNLALAYYQNDQPEKALISFQAALRCARSEQDRLTENGLLGNMGNILRELGRYDEAATHLNQALGIAQELGDSRGRGIWLSNLGLVYDDLKDFAQAIDLQRSAVKVARHLNDLPALAARLEYLGDALVGDEQFLAALTPMTEALTIQQQLGRLGETAILQHTIADLQAVLGRQATAPDVAHQHFSAALDYYGHAMNRMRSLGETTAEAEIIRAIGQVLAEAGQYDDAKQYLSVAEQMFAALGLNKQAARSRKTLQRLIDFLESEGA